MPFGSVRVGTWWNKCLLMKGYRGGKSDGRVYKIDHEPLDDLHGRRHNHHNNLGNVACAV